MPSSPLAPSVPSAARLLAAVVATALTVVTPVAAQSVLDRSPNLSGTWTGRPGTVHFNFLHRFTDTGEPQRKVLNYPTFLMAASLPGELLVGAEYGTNSELVRGIPNEWEFFARWGALDEADGAPLDVTLHGGYNHAAESLDGEVALARTFADRLRLLVAGRLFSDAYGSGESRGAWAVGATYGLTDHVAIAADYARLFDMEDAEEYAWSAGLQLAIPYTPHTLSLQASNATTTTLQGSSAGIGDTRWGFEFTVPITLSRYFGDGAGDGAAGAAGQEDEGPAAAGGAAVEVGMTNQLAFTPDSVRITVGETVRWANGSDVMHTVTADPERAVQASNVRLPEGASTFDSGNLAPGEVFEYTFTVPGRYDYVCVPHELAGMVGTVIVEEEGS